MMPSLPLNNGGMLGYECAYYALSLALADFPSLGSVILGLGGLANITLLALLSLHWMRAVSGVLTFLWWLTAIAASQGVLFFALNRTVPLIGFFFWIAGISTLLFWQKTAVVDNSSHG